MIERTERLWQRPRSEVCKCHGVTRCPDTVFSHYDDDQPVFKKRDTAVKQNTASINARLAKWLREWAADDMNPDLSDVTNPHFAECVGCKQLVMGGGVCPACLSFIADRLESDGWKDIATAPKDGSVFKDGKAVLVRYSDGAVVRSRWTSIDYDEYRDVMCFGWQPVGQVYSEHDEQPTHWMEEPPPPAENGAE